MRVEVAYACNGRVRLLVLRDGDKVYYINCDTNKAYNSLHEAEEAEC